MTTILHDQPQLLQFPCRFPIKIMGINQPQLISGVRLIIEQHVPDFNHEQDLQFRLSSKHNYLAITATITATSKDQLDSLYLALNNHPLVKITL